MRAFEFLKESNVIQGSFGRTPLHRITMKQADEVIRKVGFDLNLLYNKPFDSKIYETLIDAYMNKIKGTKDDRVMQGIIEVYRQRGVRAKELPPITEKYMGDNWQLLEVDDQFDNKVGDCYEAAFKKLYDLYKEGHENARLVHGVVTGQGDIRGLEHGHSWVEVGDTVYDWSNGRTITMPVQIYYAIGNIDPTDPDKYKTYNLKQAADMASSTQHYGHWELPKDLP